MKKPKNNNNKNRSGIAERNYDTWIKMGYNSTVAITLGEGALL